MSDVQSIHIASSIRDWYLEVKIWTTDRQFFWFVDSMEIEPKDPETIDLEALDLAQYILKAWKKHQNTMYWTDIKLTQKKGFKFYQHDPTQ